MESGYSRVAVIDFGGQYAHLIARRLRELGVYSELVPAAARGDALEAVDRYDAVVLSGGPQSVWEAGHDDIALKALSSGKPVLGICYGHQLLGKVAGGLVSRSPYPEFGPTEVEILEPGDPLFRGMPQRFTVWMSHNDAVLEPPRGWRVLARSRGSPVAAMRLGPAVGVQWHPEVSHSEYGFELLGNWLDSWGAVRGWRPEGLIDVLAEYVRREVGEGVAVAAVSGGIDSTVAALIARRALGERLKPVFIDHGLHPSGEVERVTRLLASVGLDPIVVDASHEFLGALRGVVDPEEKRRIVGKIYGEILLREAKRLGATALVQGTIYPDVIESGARPGADTIKTHHNVGGLPDLGLKIVEPLRYLYKDEVRRIARQLGVPEEIIKKQPVPGPGLAVRVEGEVTLEKLAVARMADRIVREEIEAAGLGEALWQYFAVLTASKATGVKGDARSYGYVVAVRAVHSVDAMTARPARLPWELLERIAHRITSEVPGVVRVVYDITSKPPATIEWE